MASTNDILKQIAQKLKPGETSYYIDRNNQYDKSTLTDMNNEFEKFAKNSKNWGDIINAVYDSNGLKYQAAPLRGSSTEMTFAVVNTSNKSANAFTCQVQYKDHMLIITNMLNRNQVTKFEFGSVMDSPKDTLTQEKLVDTLKRNLDSFKDKSPQELKTFLKSIITNIK